MILGDLLCAFLLIASSHASISLHSLMLIEAEEGQLNSLTLSPRTFELDLSTNTTTAAYANLKVVPGTATIFLTCRDAIVMIIRHGTTLEICSPWSATEERVMNLNGVRVGDYMVMSVVEDVATLSPNIMRNLAQLPLEFRTKGPKHPKYRNSVLDATAEGKLARTVVLKVEQDYELTVQEVAEPAAAGKHGEGTH